MGLIISKLKAVSQILRSATAKKRATMSTTTRFEFDLLGLPEELISMVIEHVDNLGSLARLSQTCSQCQRLAEAKLYRSHTLRNSSAGRQLRQLLDKRFERDLHIRTLAYLMNGAYDQNFMCLQELLERSTQLREFSFQSPEASTNDFEEEDRWMAMTDHLFHPFQLATGTDNDSKLMPHQRANPGAMKKSAPCRTLPAPLQMLNKLTLHMNGVESPYWNFDSRSKTIFRLPALECLTISCVNILDDLADGVAGKFFSALKHLHLEESNFTSKGLHTLLSWPKALETLDLLENCHNCLHFPDALHPAWNNLFRNHPIAALAALAQQKDSLKSLTYGPQYDENASVDRDPFDRTPVYEVHAGFAEFIALEYVKLVDDCPIFEQAVLSAKAPPNLKVLAVESGMPFPLFHHKVTPESVLQETSFFSAPSCSRPERFQRLELTFPLYSYEDLSHLDIVSGEHHDLLIQLANGLKAIGADLIVYTKREAGSDGSHNTSYFPPYLDGEPTPRVDLYFDGTDFVGKPK